MAETQEFSLRHDGHRHDLVVTSGQIRYEAVWSVDGVERARKRSAETKTVLDAGAVGSLALRFSVMGRPRSAALFTGPEASLMAAAGIGGVDLDPLPGSALAARQESAAAHPVRHVLLVASGAVAVLVVALLFGDAISWVGGLIPWPRIDLPDIPWPDIPWPDIHLPDVELPRLPGWVAWIVDHAMYVVPVILAVVFARREIAKGRSRGKRPEIEPGDDVRG